MPKAPASFLNVILRWKLEQIIAWDYDGQNYFEYIWIFFFFLKLVKILRILFVRKLGIAQDLLAQWTVQMYIFNRLSSHFLCYCRVIS